MARYWIRNRGRVQGPFSEERIQGLLRRGRFNRHYHVSEDRKNWYPASEFPELFAGVRGRHSADEDEASLGTATSPFDDGFDEDDEPPVTTPASPRKRQSTTRRRSSAADDEFRGDNSREDMEDDEWEDEDDEWEDEEIDGLIPRMIYWIEQHVLAVTLVLLVVLGVLTWFVFYREDFTQDIADLETLRAVQTRILQKHEQGVRADEWLLLMETTENELAPMIQRLETKANAMDMVKQELLFAARDDLPKLFKELPEGKREAQQRFQIRLGLVERMIEEGIRWHDGAQLMQPQPQQQLPSAPPAGSENQTAEPQATDGQHGSAEQQHGSPDQGTSGKGSATPSNSLQNGEQPVQSPFGAPPQPVP